MYKHKSLPAPAQNTPFPSLNLKAGKMNYRLGNLHPNWAICFKVAKTFLEVGKKNYSYLDWLNLSAMDSAWLPSLAQHHLTLTLAERACQRRRQLTASRPNCTWIRVWSHTQQECCFSKSLYMIWNFKLRPSASSQVQLLLLLLFFFQKRIGQTRIQVAIRVFQIPTWWHRFLLRQYVNSYMHSYYKFKCEFT